MVTFGQFRKCAKLDSSFGESCSLIHIKFRIRKENCNIGTRRVKFTFKCRLNRGLVVPTAARASFVLLLLSIAFTL